MNATEQLRLYRSRHVISIEPAPGYTHFGPYVCRVDGIAVLSRGSGKRPLLFRHDPDEIKRLVKAAQDEFAGGANNGPRWHNDNVDGWRA